MKFSEALAEQPEKKKAKPPAKGKTSLLNVEKAKAELAHYRAEIDKMIKAAEAHEVKDDPTDKLAVDMAGQAKRLHNRIEALRKELVDEPNQFVKAVNNLAKEYTTPLKKVENELKRKSGTYKYQKELERKEAERKAREEAEKLQKKLDEQAKEKGVEAPTVPTPVMPKEDSVTRGETGATSHIRKQWKAEIEDEAKVPREYCIPSQKLINEAIKAGVREIPGVKIFEDISSVIRT